MDSSIQQSNARCAHLGGFLFALVVDESARHLVERSDDDDDERNQLGDAAASKLRRRSHGHVLRDAAHTPETLVLERARTHDVPNLPGMSGTLRNISTIFVCRAPLYRPPSRPAKADNFVKLPGLPNLFESFTFHQPPQISSLAFFATCAAVAVVGAKLGT